LILVDPKRVEMSSYNNLSHLLCPVITEPDIVTGMFGAVVEEMERRYTLLASKNVRNIESFNKINEEKMPYIVVIVDEMADLMMTSGHRPKTKFLTEAEEQAPISLEAQVVRLAQMSRAVGIHLVLATQKPIVKVITTLIKSNMPVRISFQVTTMGDSRVILDCNGAENLIGRGDMLIAGLSSEPERYHGAWVSDEEITLVTDSLKGC
jgi:S-DNA-T family DNA segregation ATPase FtsK/SpoIIIE